jgi:hypothetical protein
LAVCDREPLCRFCVACSHHAASSAHWAPLQRLASLAFAAQTGGVRMQRASIANIDKQRLAAARKS